MKGKAQNSSTINVILFGIIESNALTTITAIAVLVLFKFPETKLSFIVPQTIQSHFYLLSLLVSREIFPSYYQLECVLSLVVTGMQ